jgi:hypothetical protein
MHPGSALTMFLAHRKDSMNYSRNTRANLSRLIAALENADVLQYCESFNARVRLTADGRLRLENCGVTFSDSADLAEFCRAHTGDAREWVRL